MSRGAAPWRSEDRVGIIELWIAGKPWGGEVRPRSPYRLTAERMVVATADLYARILAGGRPPGGLSNGA
jgi:hypothetical protein